jgi:hypothetical protein
MNHETYRERLVLLLYEELSDEGARELNDHLEICAACRKELAGLRELFVSLEELRGTGPAPEELDAARAELHGVLLEERAAGEARGAEEIGSPGREPAAGGRRRERTHGGVAAWLLRPLRPVWGGAGAGLIAVAAVVVGFFLGRIAGPPGPTPVSVEGGPGEPGAGLVAEDELIRNVRILDPAGASGEVALAYDLVRPVYVKGNPEEPRIRRVILDALTTDENPGTRLQAAGLIGGLGPATLDPDVEETLIEVLKFDDNVAVRKKALEVLETIPIDEAVKDAYLHVLLRDPNPGLRIAVLNRMDLDGLRGFRQDEKAYQALRETMESDWNPYIRMRSRNLLQEVSE